MPRPLLLLACLLLSACMPWTFLDLGDDEVFSTTPEGRAVYEQAMTRDRARDVINDMHPSDRALVKQLMSIIEIQHAAGNESNPFRIYRRVEQDLAEPVAVSAEAVKTLLEDMQAVMTAAEVSPLHSDRDDGYTLVQSMLATAPALLPTVEECFERLSALPDRQALAVLVRIYFQDDHYHSYWVEQSVLEELLNSDYGVAALPVYEEALRESYPTSYPESEYGRIVAIGRSVLTEEGFENWYREVRGAPYKWERLWAWF